LLRPSIAIIASAAVSLVGCAAPVGKPITQTVRIETPGCAAASCTLSNDLGSWRVERTPAEVSLTTSREPLKVVCRSDGDLQSAADAPSSLSPSSGVGAVAGGLSGGAAVGLAVGSVALAFVPALGAILVLSGAGIGAAAGSAIEHTQQSVAYPPVISVPLSCEVPGQKVAAPRPAPRFGVGFRGLSVSEAKALGVGERGAVLVTDVAPGSLAEAAGLRSGDVLLAANGRLMLDAGQLEALAAALVTGSALDLKVWRDGTQRDLRLSLPQAPP
jgi:hypothetical protein